MNSIFSFFSHRACKEKINKFIQSGLEDSKKIQALNSQILHLLGENQELKAMHDYQCFKLERFIDELKAKLKSRRTKRKRPKAKKIV